MTLNSVASRNAASQPLRRERRRPLHVIVGGVEERLQLGPGQRPPLRPALVLRRRAPRCCRSWHTCTGHGAGPLLALGDPAIARIAHVLQEQRQRPLIRADRRMRPPARGDPRLGLRRRPLPRPAAGERGELADQPLPLADQPDRSAAVPAAAAATRPASPPAAPPRRDRRRPVRRDQRQRPPPCPHPAPSAHAPGASTGHPPQPIRMPHPGIQRNQRREPRNHRVSRAPPAPQATPVKPQPLRRRPHAGAE